MASNNRPLTMLHTPQDPQPQASQYSLHTPVEAPPSFPPSPQTQQSAPAQSPAPRPYSWTDTDSSAGYIPPAQQQTQSQHSSPPPSQHPAQQNLYYPPPPTSPSPSDYYAGAAQHYTHQPPPLPAHNYSPRFSPPPGSMSSPPLQHPYHHSPPSSPGFAPPPVPPQPYASPEQYAMHHSPRHSSPPVPAPAPTHDYRDTARTPTPPPVGYLGHPTPTSTPAPSHTPQPQPQQPNGVANRTSMQRPPMPPEPIHTPGYNYAADTTAVSGPQTPKTPVYTPGGAAGPNGGVHAPGQIAHPNQQHGPEEYHHGLCDCFSDIGTCCLGCWCPCVLYSRTHHRLKTVPNSNLNGFTALNTQCALCCVAAPVSWLFTTLQRTRIRENYRLQGSVVDDCCKAYCCVMCTLVQDEREVRDREDERRRFAGPGSGVVGSEGYRRQTGMVYG